MFITLCVGVHAEYTRKCLTFECILENVYYSVCGCARCKNGIIMMTWCLNVFHSFTTVFELSDWFDLRTPTMHEIQEPLK